MAKKKKFTNELSDVFQYIIDVLRLQYPSDKITVPYFIVSILENEDTLAFKSLSKILLNENINTIKEIYYEKLTLNEIKNENKMVFDDIFDTYIDEAQNFIEKNNINKINSAILLQIILNNDIELKNNFKLIGTTVKQIQNSIDTEILALKDGYEVVDIPIKHEKTSKKQLNKKENSTMSIIKQMKNITSEVKKSLININKLSSEGKIEEYVGNSNLYEDIFTILSKKHNNNVIIVGKNGVGKTTLVKNISNLINNKTAPESFHKKILMQFDFISLVSGTMYKGAFENKFKPIIEDAKRNGNYILFADDIHSILNGRLAETDSDTLFDMIFSEKNIQFICCTTESGYSSLLSDHPSIAKKLQKIVLNEPSEEKCFEIINAIKINYENYHNVVYTEDAIKTSIELSKRYINECNLPVAAIDILDESGAKANLLPVNTNEIDMLIKEINDIQKQEKLLRESGNKEDYDMLDECTKREISLKSQLSIAKKKISLNKQKIKITEDDIKKIISSKTDIPLEKLTETDRKRLKNLNTEIKNIVIGQDEAVDEVCKIVKRQRIGLSNPSKPSVLFFGGSTGCGKTLLAKTIASKVFGDEKYLVRLDMSEYADKTSTNKLIGAASGYIGYEKGGILTEAIKKKKYCVLLLDEIEKANDEVHNMFLQMFDDGRMTDNKGNIVDFRNVIVIMTSNVGASEVSARGGGIGFITNKETLSKSIVSNELKKKFKPEFLNRIDKIVYFNNLNEINLKEIIKIEIKKIETKLNKLDYYIDESITDTDMVNIIYQEVKDKSNFGARPIIREVQKQIEDKITDLIIEKDIPKGYTFTKKDIS